MSVFPKSPCAQLVEWKKGTGDDGRTVIVSDTPLLQSYVFLSSCLT